MRKPDAKRLNSVQTRWILNLGFSLCLLGCNSQSPGSLSQPTLGQDPAIRLATHPSVEFRNPEPVTIVGYDQDAMEPFVSPDGQYLLFNNLNSPAVNTNLQYATRIDELTFQYQGEIQGVNTAELEGTPSMDEQNRLFFISVNSYGATQSTIYQGIFNDGRVSDVQLVDNLSRERWGFVNFDVETTRDGGALYFVDSWFGFPLEGPKTANLVLAQRTGSEFEVATNSNRILRTINTTAWEYAVTQSADQLELFFTRYNPRQPQDPPAIYVATRTTPSMAWGWPRRVSAIQGFVEAPTLSPDERSLYYHKKQGDRFVIYRVTR